MTRPQSQSYQRGHKDRGSREHDSHLVTRDGEIRQFASSKVVHTHPQNIVKNCAKLMRENDVRRLPILDAGTDRLQGLVTAIDVIDFLGGGEKYNIIKKDFDGNFLKAINCPVSKIMRSSQYITEKSEIEDIIDIMVEKRSSIIPVVEDEHDLKVTMVVTERDILPPAVDFGATVSEIMNRNIICATKGMMMKDVSKAMVRNQLRRLPLVSEGGIEGIVTALDLIGFLERGDFKGIDAEENLSERVESIMETDVITLKPDDDIGEVVKNVNNSGFGGFPVVEGKKVVGVVTTTDVLRYVYY